MKFDTESNTQNFNLLFNTNEIVDPNLDFPVMGMNLNLNMGYDVNGQSMLMPDLDTTTFHNFNLEDYKSKENQNINKELTGLVDSNESIPEDGEKMEDKEEDLLEQKRRFHIQSEQKRRAQIRDGFQTLNSLLPNLNRNGKTPSKALILKKAVHYLNGLKGNQLLMLSELERLRIENWNLKQANMFAMKDNNIDEINKNMCFY